MERRREGEGQGVESRASWESKTKLVPEMNYGDSLVLLSKRIEPYCMPLGGYRQGRSQLSLKRHVVDYDWHKWCLRPERFLYSHDQRDPLMTNNMEEAFGEKDGSKLARDPKALIESAAPCRSVKK